MKKLIVTILIVILCRTGLAAEVPKSPYIAYVYPYAEAMIKADREKHPYGQNDLRLLYTLSELSGRPNYRNAADAELKRRLEKPTGILEESRPWMLWDRCFELSADRSRELAIRSSSMRTLAAAYQRTRDDELLKLLDLESTKLPAVPLALISAAIDSGGIATRVPEPLATKLRQVASAHDEAFLSRQDPLGGTLWKPSPNEKTTAALAMLCVSRYENTGNVKYRELIHAAADAYRSNPLPTDGDISPMTFGHAISLELAAWRSAAKQEYLDSARAIADIAVRKFWTEGNPLPRELAGADTLVLSMLELHLSILHITAVRCPPNTIDR